MVKGTIHELTFIRVKKHKTLAEVASAVGTDTGNLSRVENLKQAASPELAERLVAYFGKNIITEMQILYPHRYMSKDRQNHCHH